MNNNNQNMPIKVVFVHSLFRSGSTFFYNALKRTGLFHVYHEPMHEVIGTLPVAWNELAGLKEQLKSTLRHDFLQGGYFDEYAHLLPTIKKTFNSRLSFESFFMDDKINSPELKAYLDTLIEGSLRNPILQCTRTFGRIGWIKANYASTHIFLLRNPWDQWYSYKVDSYIAATPRIIYSQKNLPAVLKEVMASREQIPLLGDDTQAELIYSYGHPITPETDYYLFFGLWLYGYVVSRMDCDVVLDMDEISSSVAYRENALKRLEDINLASINLDDAHLHRTIFTAQELSFYQVIEGQVLEIFRQHKIDHTVLDAAREYLSRQRDLAFIPEQQADAHLSRAREDAARLREILLTTGRYNAILISTLRQDIADREEQDVNLNQSLAKRDTQIAKLTDETVKRGEWALGLEQQIQDTLTEHNLQVSQLEQQLKDTLTEHNLQVSQLEQQLKNTLAEHGTQITERDGIISELRHEAADYNDKIAALEQELLNISTEYNAQAAELTDEAVRYGKWAFELEQQLKDELSKRDTQIVELTEETVKRGVWALDLDRQLNDAQATINQLSLTKSRKMIRLLRKYSRWLFEQPYAKALIKRAGKAYVSLPLSYHTRAAHRRLLAQYAPSILRVSEGLPATMSYMPSTIVLPVLDREPDVISINLMTSLQPVVSIIIPIYGQCDYTLRCLHSIANNTPFIAFEIIIINDCSPDNSAEILQQIAGIQLISNAQNQGFIRSCNIGAKVAKGEYVYFLNNDTEVTPHWLDELVRTFKNLPGTGFVGSKLIYPDGQLQEAGGIIWQDGSAWNFGRYQDPLLPEFNYAREVDYCSGASIMLPKTLFDELGGFDEHYLPAYCEDSDLALKVRDHGYRVIYQPLSVVIHYEGITSGTDVTQGTKSYQIENSKKLFQRWQERLKRHQVSGKNVDNAKDRMATRRVLVLDHCTATPNQDAGSITIFNLLLLLREMDFQVTFIPEDNFLYMPEYTSDLQRNGIEVIYAPYCTSVEQHLKETARQYELVFLFRPKVVERHLDTIRKFTPNAKILYHTVDLHYLRMQREAALLKDAGKKRKATEMKRRELAILRTVDASIVHSPIELDILKKEVPAAKIHVFPLIMDIPGTHKGFGSRKNIVFVGGYQHPPNVDAVKYFVTEIMPLLRSRLPGVHFYAVGSQVPPEIRALASKDVIITGFVEEITPLLDNMRISVAPLRYGAGIKGKVGTAMAVGLPVVATPMAAEGMLLTDGENILVADGATAFADTVVKLYEDAALWNRISKNGLEFAENSWGAEAAWKILSNITTNLGMDSQRSERKLNLYSSEVENRN